MPREPTTEEEWRALLTGDFPALTTLRKRFGRIPSEPRCKLCSAPFGGLGGKVLPLLGYGRWAGNPSICKACFEGWERQGIGGAEVPVSLMFADVRGSTGLGERLRPAEFKRLLEHFYHLGNDVVLRHDGLVDKLVGDEIVALFIPAIAGADHAGRAIAAARELLVAVGDPDATPSGPIPVGIGIHSGEAYVGVVGRPGSAWDFTALGDAVNTTARLSASAAAGEALVSVDAARAAGLDTSGQTVRSVDVRGRTEPIDVISISPATAPFGAEPARS
jgi:adenylate cyclase